MLEYDFEQSIGYWLLRASQAYERAMNAELAPRGITLRQCQVLGQLALCGELSQTDLADRMHVEPPTLVGILDRMERDGWISRQDCATDRRKKMIHALPQAEPVWAEITACARRIRARATATLSPEQLEALKGVLGTVVQNLHADSLIEEPK